MSKASHPAPVRFTLFAVTLLALPCVMTQSGSAGEVPAGLKQFLSDHCADCHTGEDAEASFDLEGLEWELSDGDRFDRWTQVHDRVAAGEMPPDSETQPEASARAEFTAKLKRQLVDFNRQRQRNHGRTTLRRLNRFEYERTVQELLGITRPLAHLLPEETPLHGFDTVSDGLRFSALHIDKYLHAAEVALDEAIRLTEAPKSLDDRFLYTEQEGINRNLKENKSILRNIDNAVVLFADASYITRIHGMHLSSAGLYRIRARAWAYQSERPVVLRLHAGNWQLGSTRVLGFFDMAPDEPREVEVIAWLEQGEYLYPAPDDLALDEKGQGVWHSGGKDYQGAGLAVEWLEVEGPLEPSWPPESVHKVFGSTPIVELKQPQWKEGKRIAYAVQPESEAGGAAQCSHRVRAARVSPATGRTTKPVVMCDWPRRPWKPTARLKTPSASACERF